MKNLTFLALAFCCNTLLNVNAQAPYSLPPLPYEYNALVSAIDAETMQIHHSKHHQAYVTNLNKALDGKKFANVPIETLLLNAGNLPDAIRNNAGGHYNHSLFWKVLTAKQTNMSDALNNAIISTFKNTDSLKNVMNQAAATRFGSGWAWLILTPEKKLVVTSTANQDNPIMDVAAVRGIPILGIDVWEHAYYLKYQNKRADYLGAIWSIIDWKQVSENFESAMKSDLLKTIEKTSWTALTEFHKVMGATFHAAEKKDFEPIKTRYQELEDKASALKNSTIPTSFNTDGIKASLAKLENETKELSKLMTKRKISDDAIYLKLEKVHDAFHEVQGLCSDVH